ncbi:hypothetical protein KFK09_020589 [Dendrobium nobile]|uniref:EF-hand domain-containing protein n=1 Tax=Dendrobium nobile TaxID=94219 RepID=A0A8T3ALD4_DENNO|nr:hypothetical protein KFK09_020589 [Dendrobium nobile]
MEVASEISFSKNDEEFNRLFSRIDVDGDGKISRTEFQLLMMRSTGEKLSTEDVDAMLKYADSDGDGFLDMEEFMAVAGIIDDASPELETKKEEQYLKEAFSHYEMDDHQGFINAKSLKRMLSRLGASRPIEDCQSMICRFDLNRDGLLSFDEFKAMMMV